MGYIKSDEFDVGEDVREHLDLSQSTVVAEFERQINETEKAEIDYRITGRRVKSQVHYG